ncbi:3-hydroxybutyrate dehydrogenase [Arthrobacter sp. zg-Y1219]|uniref:3-hydroxybutyrate dehydrogenase n=1 Tax=Arthrobacter sp. zg-Y1219 TaxID=3049067 RepID=UPI0024C2D63A|nr:3-hydroxybutyrate dehydrogenase [Arthrobacter sp. zg-Y1219]MDK1359500.1 3-hydroxybutyrate dehydrogenase [Arthrobacter sp. zg-Y1219]
MAQQGGKTTGGITTSGGTSGAKISDGGTGQASAAKRGTGGAELAGRTAVVTGGASGIGEACARHFAALGAKVTVADLNAAAAARVADDIGGTAWHVDLSQTSALEDLVLDTDILVNNAGIQRIAAIEEFDPETFRLIHRLMLEAPFLLIRAALPGMYARGFGRIINISSVHGLRASAFKSAYVSAKHGLEGLSKVTALEGGPHGVTSNCICPAYVRTPLVEAQITDQARIHGISETEVLTSVLLTEPAVKRLVEPEEVASLAGWLAGPSAGMATGSSYPMDGGWSSR